jgi:hypothetical protein
MQSGGERRSLSWERWRPAGIVVCKIRFTPARPFRYGAHHAKMRRMPRTQGNGRWRGTMAQIKGYTIPAMQKGTSDDTGHC